MPIFLSETSETLKNKAENLCIRLGHFYLGCEHLFLAIVDEVEDISNFMIQRGVDLQEFRQQILNICGPGDEEPLWRGTVTTPRLKRVLKVAEREAEDQRDYRVEPKHLLAAICREGRSIPARVLESQGQDLAQLRRDFLDRNIKNDIQPQGMNKEIYAGAGTPYSAYLAQKGRGMPPADPSGKDKSKQPPGEAEKSGKKSNTPTIDKLGRDLVQMAKEGKMDPIVGRKDEIRRMLQTLTKKMKNNPIIIGEAGVGKTAVVYGLAERIAEGNVPEAIKNKRIIELGMASIVAGTKHRGEFEEKMQKIIDELKANPDIIVFIDEIHTIIGAGDSKGGMDAGNIMKPYLARSEITVIGATTIDEFRRNIEKDPALERRFQPIMVGEPTEEETIEILNGLKERYEKHHGVKFSPKSIKAAVKMSVRYIPDRNLPDKAIDLMDEAAAKSQIHFTSISDGEQLEEVSNEITEEDIAEVVSLWTGIQAAKITQEESERLLLMEEHLCNRVVGQDEAVRTVAQTIRMARMGLTSPNRPSGVFLFLGPTGVGKTELAKTLAEFLFDSDKDMIRLDMSEYKEKHASARLIGSPPGYVGHEEEGQLTKQVRTKPYSVVLLDEVEKAHQEIFDLFLQVFDDGRLTDSKGRTVNFTNTIIIMTSNIGTASIQSLLEKKAQDPSNPAIRDEVMRELRDYFRPEFLNRIDEIVVFNPLNEKALENIVNINLKNLSEQLLQQKEIHLNLTDEAVAFLLKQGYDPVYGARPMKRAIQNYLAKPLAESMLAGGAQPGDTIVADLHQDGSRLTFESAGKVGSSSFDTLAGDQKHLDLEDSVSNPSPRKGVGSMKQEKSTLEIRKKSPKGTKDTADGDKPAQNPSVGLMRPRKLPSDNPMKLPPDKREPLLKQRNEHQNLQGMVGIKGPVVNPSDNPQDLDPEDFEETKPGKGR